MENNNVKLSSPWVTFYREIEALFSEDPDVKVVFCEAEEDYKDPVVKLYVNGQEKSEAIEELLPETKTFGNVTVYVEVIPDNEPKTTISTIKKAFEGNPALSYIATLTDLYNNPINYVVFKNKVVQFYNDNMGDINGNKSTLYQDIADDVFENLEGVFFCTDIPEGGTIKAEA